MGGGTGTGAAPVIASIARKQDILTVGIVTLPFSFEGKTKRLQAEAGIRELRKYCDTVLIILNDKLQTTLGGLSISKAFLEADNVLTTAAKSIAEIITVPGYVNVDFEDVKTVMKNAGAAVMGSAEAIGEGRALQAAEKALASPLLDYTEIQGAKKILLSIVSGQDSELQMDELTVITNYIQEKTGNDAELIFGHGSDPEMAECIRVTVIATGFGKGQVETNDLVDPLVAPQSEALLKEKETLALHATPEAATASEASLHEPPKRIHPTNKNPEASVPYPQQLPLPFAVHESTAALYAYGAKRQKKKSMEPRNWEDRNFKEQLEIPAYIRKQIILDALDSSVATPNQKRYNLEEFSENQS
jgi:cell division protein FtsZ